MKKRKIERFDPRAHRSLTNYDSSTMIRRVFWGFVQPIVRYLVPRQFYGIRNGVLRLFGAHIGEHVRIYPTAEIFYPWNICIEDHVTVGWDVKLYSLEKIIIREGAMISQGAHLCAGSHDYTAAARPLVLKPIEVGKRAWIAADAFVAPGVSIGEDSVVGARSVVMRDVDSLRVVAGNPAQVIRELETS
ncbi:MAG: putative colanic acid biosynthesis acetyltransferase [Opitutales bacterium]